jgi:hypothetical protein
MVDKAIAIVKNIGDGDNDGYAFNFAFIASIYIIEQLAEYGSTEKNLKVLVDICSSEHTIYKLGTFFSYYFIQSASNSSFVLYDTERGKFIMSDTRFLRGCIQVGNSYSLDRCYISNNFDYFILRCISGISDNGGRERHQNYLKIFTQENFKKFCNALLSGDTEVLLPMPSGDGLDVERRFIRTPAAPKKEGILYKVLTCLVPTTEIARETAETVTSNSITAEIAEAPTSTKENNVKWWIIAIIATSVLVSGFGFFMSFTSYITFSAINIIAPLIAALGLAATIALPVGIIIKKYCNSSCCNELVERFRNHPKSEEPLLGGNDKDASR